MFRHAFLANVCFANLVSQTKIRQVTFRQLGSPTWFVNSGGESRVARREARRGADLGGNRGADGDLPSSAEALEEARYAV